MKIGAERVGIEDLTKELVEELCFTATQCTAIYENVYLLGMINPPPSMIQLLIIHSTEGTSLAQPVTARAQITISRKEGRPRSRLARLYGQKAMVKSDPN